MKTLVEVQPRVAINATNTPTDANNEYVISVPGSYYLTDNLVVNKSVGLHVTSSEVTIDLSGFRISGASGTGTGILIDPASRGCVVKHGSLSLFKTGVEADGSRAGTFRQITVTSCNLVGLRSGEGWRLEECTAYDNAGTGIATAASCQISNCTAVNNQNTGFYAAGGTAFSHCTSNYNTGGISFDAGNGCTLTNCTAVGNSSSEAAAIRVGGGSTIVNCTLNNNRSSSVASYGIFAAFGSKVIGSTVQSTVSMNGSTNSSTGVGIHVASNGTIKDCVVQFSTGDGIQVPSYGVVTGCVVDNNGNASAGSGISGGYSTLVRNCLVTHSSRSGIVAQDDSIVIDNLVSRNGNFSAAAGIDTSGGGGNRVEGNSLRSNNGIGIHASGSDVVIRNSVGGSATNYNRAAELTLVRFNRPAPPPIRWRTFRSDCFFRARRLSRRGMRYRGALVR